MTFFRLSSPNISGNYFEQLAAAIVHLFIKLSSSTKLGSYKHLSAASFISYGRMIFALSFLTAFPFLLLPIFNILFWIFLIYILFLLADLSHAAKNKNNSKLISHDWLLPESEANEIISHPWFIKFFANAFVMIALVLQLISLIGTSEFYVMLYRVN